MGTMELFALRSVPLEAPALPRAHETLVTQKESGRFGRPDSFNRASQPM